MSFLAEFDFIYFFPVGSEVFFLTQKSIFQYYSSS